MKWEFCKYCDESGICENQDRGHKCETGYKILFEENEKLKELLMQVNEHFDWVSYDDSFYVNYPLWREIKKALGLKDEQLEMLQNPENVSENVANQKMQHCDDEMWEAYMDKIDELELDK